MIEIDGSYLEGGGQVVRTSVSLSALTGKAVKISNIRANRTPSGLKPQHMTGVQAVADLCNAKVEGLSLGSDKIIFEPGKIESKHLEIDIGTAGSVTLLSQALLPAAVNANKEFTFTITGGTHVRWSPPFEYLRDVFGYYLRKMGINLSIKLLRYGFYPKGGGSIRIDVSPSRPGPLVLTERGGLQSLDVYSIASKTLEDRNVADRQMKEFKKRIEREPNVAEVRYVDSFSTGSSIHAYATYDNCRLGVEAIGERNKTSEEVGRECAEKLLNELNSSSTVDVHMADQIIPYIALYGGKLKVDELSMHAKTNIWVCKQFLPVKFNHEKGVLECKR